jgi:hypothetical protein
LDVRISNFWCRRLNSFEFDPDRGAAPNNVMGSYDLTGISEGESGADTFGAIRTILRPYIDERFPSCVAYGEARPLLSDRRVWQTCDHQY